MTGKQRYSENGRSIIEILGVLAIMGILTIGAIASFRYGMTKSRTNHMIEDIQTAYLEESGLVQHHTLWTPVHFTPSSGTDLTTLFDKASHVFVKAADVDKRVCEMLLRIGSDYRFSFYDLAGNEKTECIDSDEIIVAFNGSGAPVECGGASDCGEGFEGYCNGRGRCKACQADQETDPEVEGCFCKDANQTTCVNQTDTWCCPNTQLCGEQVGECKDSDGKCAYYFGVTEDDGVVYYGDCSYTCSKGGASTTYGANCSYTVGTTGGLTGYTDAAGTARNYALPGVQSVQGCPGNQYCAIFWTQPEWSADGSTPSIGAASTGVVYGKCQMMSSYESTPVAKDSIDSGLVRVNKGCPANQYCAIFWTQPEWPHGSATPTVAAAAMGTLYGRCQMMNSYESTPLSKTKTGTAAGYHVEKECPEVQFCSLNWADENCTAAGASITGTVLGACSNMNVRNTTCPY